MSTYIGTKRQPCRLVLVQKSSNTILYMSRLRFRLRGLNFFTASTPSHSRSRREILRPQLHGARRITVDRKTRKEKKGAIIYIICSCWAKTYARYGKARRRFFYDKRTVVLTKTTWPLIHATRGRGVRFCGHSFNSGTETQYYKLKVR